MSANQGEHRAAPRPKISVGTVSTKISYDRTATVFKPTDVPEHARRAKQEVKKMLATKKNKLDVQRAEWSSSVEVSRRRRPACERKMRQLSKHEMPLLGQAYNYRAEVLPQQQAQYFPSVSKHDVSTASFVTGGGGGGARPTSAAANTTTTSSVSGWAAGGGTVRPSTSLTRTSFGEMSVNPKLDGARAWDMTTTLSVRLEKAERERMEAQARRNSLKQTRRLKKAGKKRHGKGGGGSYLDPEARYRRTLRERRKILDSGKGAEYLNKVRTGTLNPPPPHRPKLQLATGTKPRKIKVYQHSGKWEMNKATGRMHWSDTGSEDYHSRGDIVKIVNLDAYCFGVDDVKPY